VAGSIRVDIDGLAQLARTLSAIQHQLDGLGRDFGRYDAAIGAPKVKAQLSQVAGNWSIARQGINKELARLAAMAEAAAEAYRATDEAVARAAGGGAGGG
jgi:hypothetical protein